MAPEQAVEASPDIVVTGFRASLNSALNQKRRQTAAIDSIVAKDIGKFPDSNLAESMQRVPGVALSGGDGGEGRNITVRRLDAAFTRVRVTGMEGTSQTGASDIFGASNSGRSFDFSVFPTEIFSSLAVRKTSSADIEEGSLGPTVDLQSFKPLEQRSNFVLAATVRGVFNSVSDKLDPRASLIVSKKFADGTFGVLASAAHAKRTMRDIGYSAVNILPSYVNGGFCSRIGVKRVNPSITAANASRGVSATNCSTNDPRTGTVAAYNNIQSLTGVSGQSGGGVSLPRIPRFFNSV